ncbi:hypothetical protein [Sagittula sp. S175]
MIAEMIASFVMKGLAVIGWAVLLTAAVALLNMALDAIIAWFRRTK